MKALDLSEALGGVPQELIDLGLEKQAAHSSSLQPVSWPQSPLLPVWFWPSVLFH